MVGNVFTARQELYSYHLPIGNHHFGVWRYVPVLQPLYSRVNFLVLLVRRLTINVLQDSITRAQTEAQACACRCHLCYYRPARFEDSKA
jgi:hypothetical protein